MSQETCRKPKSFEGRQTVSKTNRPFPSAGFFIRRRSFDLHRAALAALFIAAGVALGFALASIPNVELVTTTIFTAGYVLGVRTGLVVGIMTEGLYSFLSPYGMAAPPLFIAQITGMAMAGLAGGLFRRSPSPRPVALAATGFFLTLNFAIITTAAYALFMNFTRESLWVSLGSGIVFYITHLISNTLIFLIIMPPLLRSLRRNAIFESLKKDQS
jgi:hypothetical protein